MDAGLAVAAIGSHGGVDGESGDGGVGEVVVRGGAGYFSMVTS